MGRSAGDITEPHSERMTVNGVRLHMRIAGHGPLVVLLHGWPETSYAWRRVIPMLTETYTTVAVDLRGCGDSERPPDGYDKRTLAADAAALIDQLGLGRARVAGHDWGGAVGYLLAAAHPALSRTMRRSRRCCQVSGWPNSPTSAADSSMRGG